MYDWAGAIDFNSSAVVSCTGNSLTPELRTEPSYKDCGIETSAAESSITPDSVGAASRPVETVTPVEQRSAQGANHKLTSVHGTQIRTDPIIHKQLLAVEPAAFVKANVQYSTSKEMNFEEGVLPPLPSDWKGDGEDSPDVRVPGRLSPPVMRKIEPVGPAFLAYARRKRHGRTFSEDDRIQAQAKVKKIEDEDDGEISEPEDPDMLARDAKDWKVGSCLIVSTRLI